MTGTAPAWSARDEGRSEIAWVRDIPWRDMARLDVEGLARAHPRVIVVAPHPDDETLAVGGLIASLVACGAVVDILLVTDGEGSHPGSPCLDQEAVRCVRRDEFIAATSRLGVNGRLVDLHVPDGAVATNAAALGEALSQLLDGGSVLVVAPWQHDGHADHDAAGRVAADVARTSGAPCVFYPLWAWHWAAASEFDWARNVLVPLTVEALTAKSDALAQYASQTSAFGQPVAEPALLHPGVLRRFERLVETLLDPDGVLPHACAQSNSGQVFDAMFEGSDDPWGVETRWYERRRTTLVEAVLPYEHLGRMLDVGCSTGALTVTLAPRAEAVVAVDASERALEIARRRTQEGAERIEWRRGSLPGALADVEGPFDTVVLSEVGYFLDGVDLLTLFAEVERLLAPGGVVLTANWQHPTRDIPLDGRFVERQFTALWPPTTRCVDEDVIISMHVRQGDAAATGGE